MMRGCVYCPKCDKSIPKEELEERSRQLKALIGNDSLARGKCPVCGTGMIDVDKTAHARNR
jgi:ssDNA-binding Zn-finger/Zn-ribbon topoisomerase 1